MLKFYKKYGKKRILLVDDEEFCMTTMEALLQAQAIDTDNLVDKCMNGKEALDKIIEAYNNDIEYSIIFMDFSMPIMNGIDSSRAIRQHLTEEMYL